jgi:hypothetical protein
MAERVSSNKGSGRRRIIFKTTNLPARGVSGVTANAERA